MSFVRFAALILVLGLDHDASAVTRDHNKAFASSMTGQQKPRGISTPDCSWEIVGSSNASTHVHIERGLRQSKAAGMHCHG